MAIVKKSLVFVFPVVLWGFLFGLGCHKNEDNEKTQKETATPMELSMHAPASSDKSQMPPNMGGTQDMGDGYPKKMMEALQKMQPEKIDSRRVKKPHVSVVVSPDIQSKWKSVVIEVANKQTGDQVNYVVDIGRDFVIPNTKIKINVPAFLPDFSMSPERITSPSDELKNPAAKVVIYEDGKKIFEGWLFEKMPMVHPFEHDIYSIKLKGQKSA